MWSCDHVTLRSLTSIFKIHICVWTHRQSTSCEELLNKDVAAPQEVSLAAAASIISVEEEQRAAVKRPADSYRE